MARMKFLCDADRCIDCNACVTACKNANEVPWGINRRRVVTINDGSPGERSVSMACMHCTDAPCAAVCPVDCFREGPNMLVIDPDECIDCTLCVPECPVEAIFAEEDVPPAEREFVALNRELARDWAVITERKQAPADADEWAKKPSKRPYLVKS